MLQADKQKDKQADKHRQIHDVIVVMICVLRDAKVEQETAESMQTLLKLDTIKARMKAASDALRVSTRHSHCNDNRQHHCSNNSYVFMAPFVPHTHTHTHTFFALYKYTYLLTDWMLISVDGTHPVSSSDVVGGRFSCFCFVGFNCFDYDFTPADCV